MPAVKLTDRAVKSLRGVAGRQVDYFDRYPRGFGARVSPKGEKSWFVMYRFGGRLRRLTFGRYPALSLSDARKHAEGALREVALGRDPAAEKKVARLAETFAELGELYLQKHAKRYKRSWAEDERILRTELLPQWRRVRASDIQRRDVRAIVEAVGERGAPVMANRVLALVRKMFNFAIEQDLIESNPCHGLRLPNPESRRDRVLSATEIAGVWKALDQESPVVAGAFRLYLLTAQRRHEVLWMPWAEVDVDAKWWTISGERSKNGLPHRVPLAAAAIEVLVALRQGDERSLCVFPGPSRAKPLATLQRPLLRIRRSSGVDFRIHDLRRTAASHMTSLGVSRLTVSKILNHAERDVTSVYDRHSYDGEKREALEVWAQALIRMVDT